MHIDLQRWLNYLLLSLSIVGGIVSGVLAGKLVDLSLGSEKVVANPVPRQIAVHQLQEDDFQIILNRNLFNSAAVGSAVEKVSLSSTEIAATVAAKPARTTGDMVLIGTVVAGEDSLALIRLGTKSGIFQLEEELSPGIIISEIGRKLVVLKDRGVRRELPLKQRTGARAQLARPDRAPTASKRGVVAVAENRWQISKAVVTNARANLNSLLQTARMIPQLENGKTIGFKLVEMKKGSLLEQIGLRVGDLIVEINQVKLNSPERALQVFQQVREANNITLGLIRNGQAKTFEYSFE